MVTQEVDRIYLEDTSSNKEIEIRENGVYIITGGTGGIGMEFANYLATKNKVNIILVNRSEFPQRDLWNNIISENTNSNLIQKINK